MRSECVSRKSGAPRALAGRIGAQPLSLPSIPKNASSSTATICMAGPLSGSFVCEETASSLPAPATPQQCPAAAGDFVWLQWLEQHRTARRICVLRAGAPYAAWTLNAISATWANAMSRFTDTQPLDDPSSRWIQAPSPCYQRASLLRAVFHHSVGSGALARYSAKVPKRGHKPLGLGDRDEPSIRAGSVPARLSAAVSAPSRSCPHRPATVGPDVTAAR